MASFSNLDMRAIFTFSDINKHTQNHLSKVYAALGSGLIVSLLSGIVSSFGIIPTSIFGLLFVATFIGEIILFFSKSHKNAIYLKAATFYSWSTIFGASVGALLDTLEGEERKLLIQAAVNSLVLTVAIFSCFTVFALLTVRRAVILQFSILLCLVLSILSLFMFHNLYACVGLVIGVLYVIIDTQIIIKKTECGIFDVFTDAKELIFDMFKIFAEILKIFLQEKKKKNKD